MARIGAGGTKIENAWIIQLKALGYKLAQRSAGSHSAIDVIAINTDNQYEGYQLKRAKYHKYVSSRLSEARKEVGHLPISIKIFCSEHRKWYSF